MLTRMTAFNSVAEVLAASDWFCKPGPGDPLAIVMQPQLIGRNGIVVALPFDQDYEGPYKGEWMW